MHVAETTKTLANGLRIAFLACPERFRERIEHAVYNVNVKTSSLDAEVVSELILGGGAREIVERKRLLLMEANDLFDRLFPGMPPGFPYPLFRWVPIDLPGRPDEIEARFRAAGVRVYHGDRFRAVGRGEGRLSARVAAHVGEPPALRARAEGVAQHTRRRGGRAAGRRASRFDGAACLPGACPFALGGVFRYT